MADAVRILHVDDDPRFVELSAKHLERLSSEFTVVNASDTDEGLDRFRSGRFDCIISDYQMPGRDGLEFLEAVREVDPDIPFILFTSKGSEEVASEAIHAGVTEYIQKGSEEERFEILANRVRNVVDRARAESSYREIFEKATDGIILHDPETGEILDVNQRMAEMTGYDREELLEMTVGDFSVNEPPYTQRDAERLIQRAAEEGPQVFEWLDETKEGELLPVEVHLKNTTIEGRDRVLAVIRDISDRRERERRLQRYINIVDNMEEGTYIFDENNRFEFVNQRVVEVSGIPAADWEGRPLATLTDLGLTTDAGVREVEDAIQRIRRGTEDEARVQLDVDLPVPMHTLELRLTDLEGNRVLGTTRNISEQKDRERALEALHDVATEIESYESENAVCERTVNAASEILDFDLCVVNLERNGKLPVIAMSAELPEHGATTMSVEEGIAGKTYRTGEPILIPEVSEHPEANPQGPYRSGISVPIARYGVFQAVAEEPGEFDESDIVLAELLVSHTATALDRITRERRLAEQNERLEEFASVVSHDLQNPLNVAQGQLDLARVECDSDRLDKFESAHDRMASLIEDVLLLAKEGDLLGTTEPVAVASIVKGCWENVATETARLEVEEMAPIEADRSQLRSLLENLFRNAVEHGGGCVTVRVGALEDGFYVEDDGVGIPPASREEVFEVGYSEASGSGLGLGIVRRIAEAHGWTVSITDGEDGGARFEFEGVTHPDEWK